jgi:amidase
MRYVILVVLSAGFAAAADLSGLWEFQLTTFGDSNYAHVNLKVDGEKLSGNLNDLTLDGTVAGDAVKFTARRPNGEIFAAFTGKLAGSELSGDAVVQEKTKAVWKAHRAADPGSHQPQTMNFEPKEFHRNFSSSIPPVLHIYPGDTVRTWTVDAGGFDPKGNSRSQGGNPETGPFYIEGAFPGDTLVVKLDRVRLNRDTAISSGTIASNALTAGYLRNAKYDEKFNSDWKLDRERMIGTPAKPTEKLKNYTVKLAPMLGCLATAPPGGQSFRSGYLGSFGGNMDYNQMREGATVYLPVYEPGALFFLGDGHAAQGDGELTGNALETSMDVQFTVDIVKNLATQGPRAENADYLMSMGIAGSLGEALQIATSQLANWLKRDYKLNDNEAAMVLGTAMRYDIAEVVDPQYHVVAKVPKEALISLK